MADVTVQLFKRRKVYVGQTRQVSVKETVLSTGDLLQRIDQDNQTYLSCRLEAGTSGRETSWKVDKTMEVSVSEMPL